MMLCGVSMAAVARAQSVVPAQDGWNVAVYPVLAWVPLGIGIDVEIPPFETDGGGAAGHHREPPRRRVIRRHGRVKRLMARGGLLHLGRVRGDRPERPVLRADLDLIYAHASFGRRIAPDLAVTGGVAAFPGIRHRAG